jgi:hypothetical protein
MAEPFTVRRPAGANNIELVKRTTSVPIKDLSDDLFAFYRQRRFGERALANADRKILRGIFEKHHTTKTLVHDLSRRVLQDRVRVSVLKRSINIGHRRQLHFWAWLWLETRRKTGGGRTPRSRPRAVQPTGIIARMVRGAGGEWPLITDANFLRSNRLWVRQNANALRNVKIIIPSDISPFKPSTHTLAPMNNRSTPSIGNSALTPRRLQGLFSYLGGKIHGKFVKRDASNVVASAANLKSHLQPFYRTHAPAIRLNTNKERRGLLALLEQKNLSKAAAHKFAARVIKEKVKSPGNLNIENLTFWAWLEQVTLPTNSRQRVHLGTRVRNLVAMQPR